MAALSRIRRGVFKQLSVSSSNYLQPSLSLLISRRGIASKLFVGGLSFYTTEKGLLEAFGKHGQVVEAKVVMDRVSDRSKGFGFVTFASEDEAETAKTVMDGKVRAMHVSIATCGSRIRPLGNRLSVNKGKELNGRFIFVDYAKPKTNFGGGMPIARGPPEPTVEQ